MMLNVGLLSVAQHVKTVIFFSACDKSRVKWDNSRISTQKVRTLKALIPPFTFNLKTFTILFRPNYDNRLVYYGLLANICFV